MRVEDIAVKHNGNAKAIEALDRILEGNLPMMNPVVIVGNIGTGKSYILKAVGDVLGFRQGMQDVKLMRCEEFVNLYIEALKADSVANFRNRMTMGVNAFLLDDVDYLVEKSAAAFELTQRIENLMQCHVKIVLTSSMPISCLRKDGATKQLGSKISEGVELNLSCPDTESRIAIIADILNRAGESLPRGMIEGIAMSVERDLHCLVGQVRKAILDARLNKAKEIGK